MIEPIVQSLLDMCFDLILIILISYDYYEVVFDYKYKKFSKYLSVN